jgi:hypothetical protein
MAAILATNSFMGNPERTSYYDVVFPLYDLSTSPPPRLIGTCFAIGVGIYLTAAHNFDVFAQVRAKYRRNDGDRTPLTAKEMLARKRDMDNHRFLEGTNVNLAPLIFDQPALRQGDLRSNGFTLPSFVTVAYDFDVAVLFAPNDRRRNPSGQPMPIAALSIQETPTIGQHIEVAGFPGAHQRIETTGEGVDRLTSIGLSMIVNEGEITKLHDIMRDSGLAWFPCMETTVDILPGHSGGPALCKETLSVVGINSTGGFPGYGVVSWIGKALDVEMVIAQGLIIADKEVPAGDSVTLRDLAKAHFIQIV